MADDGPDDREAQALLERTAGNCREADRLRAAARGGGRGDPAAQDQLRTQAAAAQTPLATLEPGLDQARTRDALEAWGAAQPWRSHSRSAAEVADRAERRLEQLQPDLMRQYRDNLAGHPSPDSTLRADAMLDAARVVELRQVDVVTADPRADLGAALADRSAAMDERAAAQQDLAEPDVVSTPNVDERAVAAARGADHQELADARTAHAETRMSQAYPATVQTALVARSGPQAGVAKAPARSAAQTASQAPVRRGR